MEVELVTESQLEEYNTFGVDDDNDDSNYEGERCGICMDVVIDRGVLDCCQHWFCFACIDNWSTITNLCPLCQNEFQLITCVPVYDTIGTNNDEDDLTSREDDWCIEGKNNTLSFPSYYIDENAVVCLDGEGCKIRSRAVTIEEDPNLDTSIACDSCDLWYHAFCVGFDPEGPSQDSWLCPRCVDDEIPLKPSNVPLQSSENIASNSERLVEDTDTFTETFSGKVSVSIADTGETAVVVSLVEEKQSNVESSRNFFSTLDGNLSVEKPSIESDSSGTQNLELSISKLASFNDLHTKETSIQSASELNKSESRGHGFDLHLGLSVSYNSVDETTNHQVEDHIIEDVEQKHSSILCFLPTDNVIPDKEITVETAGPTNKVIQDKRENIVESVGAKRKSRDFRGVENGEGKSSATAKVSAKKVKFEGKSQLIHKENQSEEKFFSHEHKKSRKDEKSTSQSEIGIMDIVQGTYGKPIKQARSSKGEEKAAGLRVKKILRRSTEDKESSILVQKLRKEIRDSIRDKSSEQTGENNLYDPKLLEAFRAVVAKPMTDFNRPRPLDVVRAKKSLLQKGKVRESLTKKIYGIGGRRKKAWTRDCEVEFWKHRCLKIGKPEKIETLKSVLGLLRTNCESSDQKQTSESGPENSILSRLYLADSSVFPRKDDIKPLSVIKETKQNAGSASQTMDNVGAKSNNAIVKSETSIKVNPSGSTSGGSKEKSEKEASVDIRSDKRKWALQVLARKTAVTDKNVAQEQVAVLQGNFPLLAQLPADMRPVLATSRHNKVPISVRQAQLQRLTEHFLKLTKIPVTRRTAEIELAVADAVNIEKEIADKSSSKLVYVNLCAQELLRRSDNMTSSVKVQESNPDPSPNDKLIESANDLTSCLDADEALRNAGLLSDSPPNSPNNENYEKDSQPENVFEVDCQPDLDIYGDFEYDLEDEEFIGASSLKKPDHIPPEESKIKVLFSTLDSDRSNGEQISENLEEKQADNLVEKQPEILEEKQAENLQVKQAENLEEKQDLNKKLEESSVQNPSTNGEEEPSSAECEELYGPDKEPLIKKFPETSLVNPCEPVLEKVDHGEPVLDKEDRGKNSSQKNPTRKEKTSNSESSKKSDRINLIRNKVEAYIKEHIRPLCKSGVITVEQYKWAVGKTSDKIMKYHSKATNASFLIKEGEKVKKLAEQYVEAAQWEEGL